MDFDDYYVGKIPIPKLNKNQQQATFSVVEKILSLTAEEYPTSEFKQNKTKDYEHQIDHMVYELYGLTPEEIELVEDFRGDPLLTINKQT